MRRVREDHWLGKTFTLDEAKTLLPVLSALLEKARGAALRAGALENEMQELSQRIFLSGGLHVDVPAAARRRAEREKAMQEARSQIEEITEIGVEVSDQDEGGLEFPCLPGRADGDALLEVGGGRDYRVA